MPHARYNVPDPPATEQPAACGRGSQLFFQDLFQQLLAQHLVRQQPLETLVLSLQFFQLLGLVGLQHPDLTLPPMERLLADLMRPADIQNRPTCLVRLPQNPNLLLRRVTLALHPSPSTCFTTMVELA